MVDERADVDAHRAGFLAGTVGALHAARGFGEGFLFGVEAVVEAAGPVVAEVCLADAFEFDFVVVSVLLPGLGVNYLRLVQLGCCG